MADAPLIRNGESFIVDHVVETTDPADVEQLVGSSTAGYPRLSNVEWSHVDVEGSLLPLLAAPTD